MSADLERLKGLWLAAQNAGRGDTVRSAPAVLQRSEESAAFDPFVYLDLTLTVTIVGQRISERVTERTIQATSDGVDRFILRAAIYRQSPEQADIELKALLNCRIGRIDTIKTSEPNEIRRADVLLPHPLLRGETCFFATSATYHRDAGSDDFTQVEVTGQRADRVRVRVQFDPNAVPLRCWTFEGGPEADKWLEPVGDSTRLRAISELGYVEHEFRDLPAASKAGLVWRWE